MFMDETQNPQTIESREEISGAFRDMERLMISWRSLAQEMTPGGSEFMTPESVRDYYLQFKSEAHQVKIENVKLRRALSGIKNPYAVPALVSFVTLAVESLGNGEPILSHTGFHNGLIKHLDALGSEVPTPADAKGKEI